MKPPDTATAARPELLARTMMLVVLNGAVALLGAPTWVTAPLALVILAVVSERVARHRCRGPLDHIITAIAGCFVALILLGVVLNFTPWTITTGSWTAGVTLLELVALGFCVGRPSPPSLFDQLHQAPRPSAFNATAGVAGTLLVIGVIAASAFTADAVRVDGIALSSTKPTGGFADVSIDIGSTGGTFDLLRLTGDESLVLAAHLQAAPHDVMTLTVEVPNYERSELRLYRTGDTEPLRTLILDRTITEP